MNNADSFQDLIRNSLVVHESATKFEKKSDRLHITLIRYQIL